MEEGNEVAGGVRRVRGALAAGVFVLALVVAFWGFWGSDLTLSVPLPASELTARDGSERPVDPLLLNDYRMGVWAFSRNAWTLLHRPARIFQAEPCHPADDALALHHPVITQGLLAVPGWILTGDPVATTNLLILLSVLLGAGAMCLLVADWTGVLAAGVVAGLLHAFHPDAIGAPFHLGTRDYTWTLLALFFARRLFDGGRVRDAVGLAACGILQMATSFYPLLGAAVIALPVLVWLVWRAGPRRVPWGPLVAVAVVVAAAAAWLFAPYLSLAEAGVLQREQRFFAAWSEFAPGGERFPGWTCLVLVAAALVLGRRRAFPGLGGDPRRALGVAALLLAWIATGGNVEAQLAALKRGEPGPPQLPNLFSVLRPLLPGLDAIRMPSMLAAGARTLLCVLAGFGAAALLRLVPRAARAPAAAGLVLVTFVAMLRPAFLGLTPPVSFEPLAIRPSDDAIAFFRELEAAGNTGPLLEVPIERGNVAYGFHTAPVQHMLSAWHHRRTSGCSPAFTPPAVFALAALSQELILPGGLERARELGFTTVVVHHPPGQNRAERYAARVARVARVAPDRLERIVGNDALTAYAIRNP